MTQKISLRSLSLHRALLRSSYPIHTYIQAGDTSLFSTAVGVILKACMHVCICNCTWIYSSLKCAPCFFRSHLDNPKLFDDIKGSKITTKDVDFESGKKGILLDVTCVPGNPVQQVCTVQRNILLKEMSAAATDNPRVPTDEHKNKQKALKDSCWNRGNFCWSDEVSIFLGQKIDTFYDYTDLNTINFNEKKLSAWADWRHVSEIFT